MSNSQFILDYLPSFYKNFITDSDGNNLLSPIFDIYYNAMGDAVSQGQQIAMVPFIESCDPIIIEFFSTIDVTEDNRYLDGYIIDSEIIKLEGLYLNGNLTRTIIGTFDIKHDISNHIRYIVFNTSLPLTQSTIFVQKVYRDKQILQNIWGNLINYQKQIPDYNTLSDGFIVDYNSIKSQLDLYKSQLIALVYGLINGPTIYTIYNGLGIFLGYKYAPFDGVIIEKQTNLLILESTDGTKNYTITPTNVKSDLNIGSKIKKYELLEEPFIKICDIVNDPAFFTQFILEGQAQKYLTLLNIDTSNNEQYAHLTFDSTISYDDMGLFWDMGNGTDVVQDLTGTTTIAQLNQNLIATVNRFDTWVSPLFEDQKLYEMFRNIFIVYKLHTLSNESDLIKIYLDRIKPKWTKYILETFA
jgi:hypothetical protein